MSERVTNPLVSVCLITYNHVDFIKEAIESILEQEAIFNWNIIIADDCSNDGTTEIVKQFAANFPHKIQLILQNINVGLHANFIDLFTAPTSKYVAFLDGDDIWSDRHRLSKQVDFLEANPNIGMIYGKYSLMNHLGCSIPLKKYPSYKSGYIFKDILKHYYLPPMAAALMRNEFIQEIYKEKSAPGIDFYLIASICKMSKVAFIDEIYYSYRINGASITNSQVPMMSALFIKNISLFNDEFPFEVKTGIKNWKLKQLYFSVDKKPNLTQFILLLKNFNFSGMHVRQLAKCFLRICKIKKA